MILDKAQKDQFNEILEELGNTLDISKSEFEAVEKSYEAVGNWLANYDSPLAPYKPTIAPQGSFILGTMIKPIHEKDDLDIDLVCELTGKKTEWTQSDLKKIVGDRLKAHDVYKNLLDKEGKRCWTLKYRKQSDRADKYHMDILPSIISFGYREILNKSFSAIEDTDYKKLAIRITDNTLPNYTREINPEYWLKSNPFGFARWFYNRATTNVDKAFSLMEAVKPIPSYQENKLPLQRVVQILKRHRDIMFDGADHKPISIIITTLAAHAYRKQTDILEALVDVVARMDLFIEGKQDPITGKIYKFIGNPSNPEENFADRWIKEPQRQVKFYEWLERVKRDINHFITLRGHNLQESLANTFGKTEIAKTLTNIGNRTKNLTEQGQGKFDIKYGIAVSATNPYKAHTFYGNEN